MYHSISEHIGKEKHNKWRVKPEDFENNDNKLLSGTVEQSNVNRVSTMVELIDAHRRFDQSQRAIKTIDELNAGLIEKIGGNTR